MKIAALYCTWGDQQLLELSIKNIQPVVDGVLVGYSIYSNFMERDPKMDFLENVTYVKVCMNNTWQPRENETFKRNHILDKAKELGYTHFIMMDADEFYDRKQFKNELEKFKNPDLMGLVCRTQVYFKSPDLTIGLDTTLVPFIHKLTPELKFEFNRRYPFAWEGNNIRIDPTRSMNINSGVEMSEIIMHHYSWVRSDVRRKVRNSTARQNLEQSTILTDYCHAKPGYYCQFYKAEIVSCANLFNIPDIIDHELLRIQASKSRPAGGDRSAEGLLEKDNPVRS